jgi:hypothetical protein
LAEEADLQMCKVMRIPTIVVGSLAYVLLLAVEGQAGPLTIQILQAEYTTTVASQIYNFDTETAIERIRTTVSQTPIGDALSITDGVEAVSAADLFAVDLFTQAFPTDPLAFASFAQASALSMIQFSPTQSGTVPIGLEFVGRDKGFIASTSSVSLFDLSASNLLWSYGTLAGGSVAPLPPWTFSQTPCLAHCRGDGELFTATAMLDVDTLLDATHVYALTLFAQTAADKDREFFTTRVSGLRPVPEPSSVLLLTTASAGFWVRCVRERRRRHS